MIISEYPCHPRSQPLVHPSLRSKNETPAESANIARHLSVAAAAQPDFPALKIPRGHTRDGTIDYLTLTFFELEAEVAAWQARLRRAGVRPGDRVLVMVRQGLPLIAGVFALFASGAVPVVIDPGMGRRNFLACVAHSRPRVLLGVPLARLLSRVFRPAFRSVETRLPASSRLTARLTHRSRVSDFKSEIAASAASDPAAILFTSGSTGSPKGVPYAHGQFDAQLRLIRDTYAIAPGEIDLPMLPVFALFNPALGMTTVVPEIDPSRPAAADPARLVQAIRQENVTNSFGSPTLWRRIAAYCEEHRIQLPSLRRVLCAGAPVPPDLWPRMRTILPQGELHSPYGATEALPVSTIRGREVTPAIAAATVAGAGTCVGRVIAGNDVRIIALADGAIARLSDAHELPPGQIGEIIVRGPSVTTTYDHLPEATQRAKIQTPNAKSQNPGPAVSDSSSLAFGPLAFEIFHRTGDCGYFDGEGRLWFCGRAAERVERRGAAALHPAQVEPVFNTHPRVRRSALIGLGARGDQRPALVVEATEPAAVRTSAARRELGRQLHELARGHVHAARIRLFFFHPRLPVDVRHNAKIHRLALARWAATRGEVTSDK